MDNSSALTHPGGCLAPSGAGFSPPMIEGTWVTSDLMSHHTAALHVPPKPSMGPSSPAISSSSQGCKRLPVLRAAPLLLLGTSRSSGAAGDPKVPQVGLGGGASWEHQQSGALQTRLHSTKSFALQGDRVFLSLLNSLLVPSCFSPTSGPRPRCCAVGMSAERIWARRKCLRSPCDSGSLHPARAPLPSHGQFSHCLLGRFISQKPAGFV